MNREAPAIKEKQVIDNVEEQRSSLEANEKKKSNMHVLLGIFFGSAVLLASLISFVAWKKFIPKEQGSSSKSLSIERARSEGLLALTARCSFDEYKDFMGMEGFGPKEINTPDEEDQETPFTYAIKKSDLEAAKCFYKLGAQIDIHPCTYTSILHYAAAFSNPQMLDWVISIAPSSINEKSPLSGETPLHFAAESLNRDAFSVLLDKGADPNLLDNAGNTYLALYKQKKDATK